MDITEEIKWSKLIIELYTQYCKQVYLDSNMEEASKTLERLNKMKLTNPAVFDKVRLLELSRIDQEYHTMAIIKEKAHHGIAYCTAPQVSNITSTLSLLEKPLTEFEKKTLIKEAHKSINDLSICLKYFDNDTRVTTEMRNVLTEILREICDGVTHMSWDRVQELSRKIESALNKK